MKKKLLKTIFLIGAIYNVQSQVNFGITGGLNYTNNINHEESKNNRNTDYIFGLNIGGYVKKSINDKWNFKPEFLYYEKGYKVKSSVGDTAEFKFNYISVPILFEYNIIEKTHIEIGPELSYLLNTENSYEYEFENQTFRISEIWDKRFDLGISIGANYKLTEKFYLNIRYNQGLLSTVKENENELGSVDIEGNVYSKKILRLNRSFQFGMRYEIR